MESFFVKVRISDFGQKPNGEVIVSSNLRETKGYSPGFFFAVRKKVLRKVNHFKVLEKRN